VKLSIPGARSCPGEGERCEHQQSDGRGGCEVVHDAGDREAVGDEVAGVDDQRLCRCVGEEQAHQCHDDSEGHGRDQYRADGAQRRQRGDSGLEVDVVEP